MAKVFCAIDTQDLKEAETLALQLSGLPLHLKLGLEFFVANGIEGVRRVRAAMPQAELFLDLKLHDIPNTVAGAIRAAALCGPEFITVHASGGKEMMEAAVKAAKDCPHQPRILAVTVLTSLNDHDLQQMGQPPASEQVSKLARLAKEAGAAGIVCSPHEIDMLRRDVGRDFLLVVPGIRPDGSATHDQKRTMTPREAALAGADYLVIGRPITQSADPAVAAEKICRAV